MASAAVAVQEEKLIAQGWIINRKDDLIWFVGSVLASYALLCANLIFGISAAVLTWDPLESTCRHASLSIL